MLRPTDLQLVAGFLLREQERFESYLSEMEIDETEALIIVEDFINNKAYKPATPPYTERVSGSIGE